MSTADMHLSSPRRYVASASSKLSSVRGYLGNSAPFSRAANAVNTTPEQRQTWRAWASQKIRGKGRTGREILNKEVLTLFPGWAARRYPRQTKLVVLDEPVPFDVEVFVSGYAFSSRSKEQASRSQRAFIRLAKSFASLPRRLDSTSSTEELANSSLSSVQASEEFQAEVLDQHLQRAKAINSDSDSECVSDSATPSRQLSTYFTSTPPPEAIHTPEDLLQKLHYNLETRLQPFWSSALPSRTVRLHLFIDTEEDGNHSLPLATEDVTTGADGSFGSRFRISWGDLRNHPKALGEPTTECNVIVVAELLPPPPSTCSVTRSSPPSPAPEPSPSSPSSVPPSPIFKPQLPRTSSDYYTHTFPHLHTLLSSLTSTLRSTIESVLAPASTASTHIRVPITHSPIRVISDIDDTIKLSSIPEGARAVFHSVFVKELKDGIIRGMGEWYTRMYEKGVRFHYVSNGPYGYLSVLYEFFELSKLPPGSIKLKSYAGRSLLSGLLSAPAARKRAGVVEILDSFPDSKFILIGDSGEQDLELYADLSRERPDQICAVLIRDAEETSYPPIDDPTGWKTVAAGKSGARSNSEPLLVYDDPSPSTSPPPSSPRDEYGHIKAPQSRPGLGPKRTLSETYAHIRTQRTTEASESTVRQSPGVVFANGPLNEEPISDGEDQPDTPKQTTFPSLPCGQTNSGTYITKPPSPVQPPRISFQPSSSSNDATIRKRNMDTRTNIGTDSPYTYDYNLPQPVTKTGSTRSTGSTASSSSSSFYKGSDPYSRLPSLAPLSRLARFRRRGSAASGIGDNETIMIDNNATGNSKYAAYTRRGSGAGSSGGTSVSGSSSGGKLTEAEKKRTELQMRVHRARTQMPSGVPLRVFRDPGECEEDVGGILGRGAIKC